MTREAEGTAMDPGNFPAVVSVPCDPHYLPTMVSKNYSIMTPTFSKANMESGPVHSSSRGMHFYTEESNCFQIPHVSRNINDSEAASYMWPAWLNNPSSTTHTKNGTAFIASQNSAFKSYASFGRKGVGRGANTDVAEALTLLGGWPGISETQTFE